MEYPKTFFYSFGEGTLLVKATTAELDAIERALAPQIHVRAQFIEVPEELLTSVWESLGLGKAENSTLPSILSSPAYRAVLKPLTSDPRCQTLGDGSVVTLSGRQTQLQTIDLVAVVTGIDPRALTPPGVSGGNGYVTTNFPSGTTLDMVPIATNGYEVHLTVIPSVVEFLAYDEPTNPVTVYIDGKEQKIIQPLPHFRVRSVTNSVTVWDGQTLVLGGLVSRETADPAGPGTQPAPAASGGGSTRSAANNGEKKKQLLVFVTPTLIDAAGNRIHPDTEPPTPVGSQK
jgi:general secretion pathway protein D